MVYASDYFRLGVMPLKITLAAIHTQPSIIMPKLFSRLFYWKISKITCLAMLQQIAILLS